MPLLDIEKIISKPNLKSRFKLVHVAGLRARELNSPKEDTLSKKSDEYSKNTTNALNEIITGKIDFDQQDD
ncbi:DNA-directed RNA polymerase subunit omega [Seleniivibrio sp.]|uniref:DNA-directed RNA polymerase subunit omega n=1 Tax=Seleniivibrio sp. TaxID=2898801 RepID=UPI0025F22504|nr:DNA-directed RNA polymerase subunit omega [Seleniivibrio sp.]MCD8552915.1 DNA-directed RNA polymerase subunit omega [Seleniivibrio sp.]